MLDQLSPPATDAPIDAEMLLALAERARDHAEQDPFGNPVLAVALAILRRIDSGELEEPALAAIIRALRDDAFADRATRLAAYVGLTGGDAASPRAFSALAARLVRPDPHDSPVQFAHYRAMVERCRFAAVFTAHPTFALPLAVYGSLAEAASGRPTGESAPSHRPSAPTLDQEFAQAMAAIVRGRDALDAFALALLEAAEAAWPNRWTELNPAPVILASWVGFDTDGRVDIHWWDTLRLRLESKRLQLARLDDQLRPIAVAAALSARIATALDAVNRQIAACPTNADAGGVSGFAEALIGGRDAAMISAETLTPLFAEAIERCEGADQRALCVARAGLVSHGLSIAHTHFRLNASQIHNAVRLRLGLEDPPADPFRRRMLLASVNAALDKVEAVPVDFGSLLVEQASATRLMMLVAQIVKHIDVDAPIRFLIAETESGYTLLSALWLARLLGVSERIEISPLFETAAALEDGGHIMEEALRSPHYRDYLRRLGRIAIQFGYSDSGRYVGQLAATFLIERLRLKIGELLVKFELTGVEIVFFDTHGESIGRGAHPGSLIDRLKYLSPSATRLSLGRMGLTVRDESAFQGGDGYLLFGTPELAAASIAAIAQHVFDPPSPVPDPIYQEADFAAGFFASISASMRDLVEDPGYVALLGAFGPALLDPTGSRPSARQSDGLLGTTMIRHPRELRAIPNNAILQQLGWCANTLQGLGSAAARQPELFTELRQTSPRFKRALQLAGHALKHSDIDVLRAVAGLVDPGTWLDRASHGPAAEEAHALVAVAQSLDRMNIWAPVQAMFRRIQTDDILLHAAWPDAPRMSARETLLHALRLALIQRIWLMSTNVPDFSPRHGLTRQALGQRLLQLDVPAALAFLGEVFPAAADPSVERDFGEPRGPRGTVAYAREHSAILEPIGRMFALVREIGTAITHEVGAFG